MEVHYNCYFIEWIIFSFNAPVLLEMYCSKRERRRGGGSSCETCQMLAKAPSVPKQFWLHSLVRDPFSFFFSFTYTMEMIRQAELEPERTWKNPHQNIPRLISSFKIPPNRSFSNSKTSPNSIVASLCDASLAPCFGRAGFPDLCLAQKETKRSNENPSLLSLYFFTSLLLSRSSLPPSLQFLWITSCKSPFLSAFTAFSFFNFLLLLLPSARTFIVESSSS